MIQKNKFIIFVFAITFFVFFIKSQLIKTKYLSLETKRIYENHSRVAKKILEENIIWKNFGKNSVQLQKLTWFDGVFNQNNNKRFSFYNLILGEYRNFFSINLQTKKNEITNQSDLNLGNISAEEQIVNIYPNNYYKIAQLAFVLSIAKDGLSNKDHVKSYLATVYNSFYYKSFANFNLVDDYSKVLNRGDLYFIINDKINIITPVGYKKKNFVITSILKNSYVTKKIKIN